MKLETIPEFDMICNNESNESEDTIKEFKKCRFINKNMGKKIIPLFK